MFPVVPVRKRCNQRQGRIVPFICTDRERIFRHSGKGCIQQAAVVVYGKRTAVRQINFAIVPFYHHTVPHENVQDMHNRGFCNPQCTGNLTGRYIWGCCSCIADCKQISQVGIAQCYVHHSISSSPHYSAADKKCGGPRALLPAARRAGIQENFNFLKSTPHNSKCRYGERGATAAKPKAQIILDAAKVSAASGGNSEPK